MPSEERSGKLPILILLSTRKSRAFPLQFKKSKMEFIVSKGYLKHIP